MGSGRKGLETSKPPAGVEVVGRDESVADPAGGRQNVPVGARVVVLINKVEMLGDRGPAREAAERLIREPAIASVVLGAAAGDKPVLEVFTR